MDCLPSVQELSKEVELVERNGSNYIHQFNCDNPQDFMKVFAQVPSNVLDDRLYVLKKQGAANTPTSMFSFFSNPRVNEHCDKYNATTYSKFWIDIQTGFLFTPTLLHDVVFEPGVKNALLRRIFGSILGGYTGQVTSEGRLEIGVLCRKNDLECDLARTFVMKDQTLLCPATSAPIIDCERNSYAVRGFTKAAVHTPEFQGACHAVSGGTGKLYWLYNPDPFSWGSSSLVGV
jgi:hypothetical protein